VVFVYYLIMQIGKIDIEKPLLLAPMEDVTDQAFRIVCRRIGADIVYTEFVNSEDSLGILQRQKENGFLR